MIQDVLSNHVIELLQTPAVENKVIWPGPIARELVAEVQWLLIARPHKGGLGLFGIRNRLELLGGAILN